MRLCNFICSQQANLIEKGLMGYHVPEYRHSLDFMYSQHFSFFIYWYTFRKFEPCDYMHRLEPFKMLDQIFQSCVEHYFLKQLMNYIYTSTTRDLSGIMLLCEKCEKCFRQLQCKRSLAIINQSCLMLRYQAVSGTLGSNA